MPIMDMLPKGNTLQIPLDAPTSLAATAGNAQVELTWTDPKDKYATPEGEVTEEGDQLVSEWAYTRIIRKTGSAPTGPNDGVLVVDSSVRDQYASTGYVDSGLTNGTTYYYGAYAYNKDGVASEGAFVTATPKAGTPLSELAEGTLIKINENGSPVEFYLAKHNYEPGLNGEGRELVVRKDCYSQGRFGLSASSDDAYANSTGDRWANSTYKGLFTPTVQEFMGATKFYYRKVGQSSTGTATLERAVFFVSLGEFGLSGGQWFVAVGTKLPIASSLTIAQYNEAPVWQFARESGRWSGSTMLQAAVTSSGATECADNRSDTYFRPCFTLPSTALVTEELELVEG